MSKVRCAIYTRKSSEEGLEQDFNSLDAQREACAAYVLSQASEGWSLLPGVYDDGGISGGTLARPALQRLLDDIEAGRIDIVVVYKVDRLTRSLLDFARLVETMDKAGTSFVSVTQSFNTTTSMGRLTLNMLLSFAQFEREVTAERIRDKIAASKAKGMWMGGTPPLGYEPNGRTLTIVSKHAAVVRSLYERYLELGTVRLLTEALDDEGTLVPERRIGKTRRIGGVPFSRGQIYRILANPIYIGKIAHRGTVHEGQHERIVEQALWNSVQVKLKDNVQGTQRAASQRHGSILAGRCFDAQDEPLVASHACKGARRYRYYVSRALQHGGANARGTGMRIPALELEKTVAQHIADSLGDPLALMAQLAPDAAPEQSRMVLTAIAGLAEAICKRQRQAMRSLCRRVTVRSDHIVIELDAKRLGEQLSLPVPGELSPILLDVPVRLQKSGRRLTFVQDGIQEHGGEPNPELVRLIARARSWWKRLGEGQITITELAREQEMTSSYISRVVRLNFLAPAMVEAILSGRQPASVSAQSLRLLDLPIEWDEQMRALGA